MKLYHTEITVEQVCKNGSNELGSIAKCMFWFCDPRPPMEFEMFAKKGIDAKEKMRSFLSDDGKNEIIQAGLPITHQTI